MLVASTQCVYVMLLSTGTRQVLPAEVSTALPTQIYFVQYETRMKSSGIEAEAPLSQPPARTMPQPR